MNRRIIRAFFKSSECAVFFDENLPNLTAFGKSEITCPESESEITCPESESEITCPESEGRDDSFWRQNGVVSDSRAVLYKAPSPNNDILT